MALPKYNTLKYKASRRRWYAKNAVRLRAQQKEWRADNKEKRKAYNTKWQEDKKRWFYEYKVGLQCERCGYNKCVEGLAFHHKSHGDKDFNITFGVGNFYPREIIMEEIGKCVVLCLNCHAELHVQERTTKRAPQKAAEQKQYALGF